MAAPASAVSATRPVVRVRRILARDDADDGVCVYVFGLFARVARRSLWAGSCVCARALWPRERVERPFERRSVAWLAPVAWDGKGCEKGLNNGKDKPVPPSAGGAGFGGPAAGWLHLAVEKIGLNRMTRGSIDRGALGGHGRAVVRGQDRFRGGNGTSHVDLMIHSYASWAYGVEEAGVSPLVGRVGGPGRSQPRESTAPTYVRRGLTALRTTRCLLGSTEDRSRGGEGCVAVLDA